MLAALELEASPADGRSRLFVLALGHGELCEKLGPSGQHRPAAPGRVGRSAHWPSVPCATAAPRISSYSPGADHLVHRPLPVWYSHIDLRTSGRDLDQLACPVLGQCSGTCASVSASGQESQCREGGGRTSAMRSPAGLPGRRPKARSAAASPAVLSGRDQTAAIWPGVISAKGFQCRQYTSSGVHGPNGAAWIDAHTIS